MNAAIIAIGSEMLGMGRSETNSLKITRSLEQHGVRLKRKAIVGDDRDEITAELRMALERADVVLVSGGLGPTEDDITTEVVAALLGLELVLDERVLQKIRDRFAARGLEMPEVNRKQAMVFQGHEPLVNSRGTAPGFHLSIVHEGREKELWLFPGVPHELEGLLESELEPWLALRGGEKWERRSVRTVGLAESQIEELLRPFYQEYGSEHVTILAGGGEVQIHLESERGVSQLDAMTSELRQRLGTAVLGIDEESLESVVGSLLLKRRETVATAESCSGGLLSSRITDVAGSSAYFLGGVISYTREAKLFLLGVDPAVIDSGGEVSEEVARQMARGAHRRFGSTYGIGITGIAGPGGGSEAKPVGTVHIAVATPLTVEHRLLQLTGSRMMIKQASTQQALNLLRLTLMQQAP